MKNVDMYEHTGEGETYDEETVDIATTQPNSGMCECTLYTTIAAKIIARKFNPSIDRALYYN